MKANQHLCSWSLRSVISNDGRRVIKLWRTSAYNGSQTHVAKHPPAVQRTGGLKLSVQFAPEEASAFAPFIRRRLPARRRVAYQPKLQLLSQA